MASLFTTIQQQQPQHTSNLVGPDIKLIASSFVKQYYTLLNKAPCFIHNFYNHDSTFIHGTIEMGNEHPTEPVVGREQIENKMKELKLNDCRAKIKQIDCLETLAGGLVIQVIGELSNNGRPMRRFLQTFVLAPSPDQTRHDGDSKAQMRAATTANATTNTNNNTTNDNRRSVQISENSTSSSHNQKFYVLNSIFRYQDDGPDSEFEDDSVSVQANTSIESANGAATEINDDNHNIRAKPVIRAQQQPTQQSVAPVTSTATTVPAAPKQPTVPEAGPVEPSKRVESCHTTTKAGGPPNGMGGPQADRQSDKKSEVSEKALNENGKFSSNDNQSQVAHPPKGGPGAASTAASQGAVSTVVAQQSSAPAPRPSNEPKTWANMVRNALPPSSTVQAPTVTSSKEQQSSPNQAHHTQNNQQNPQQNEHLQSAQNNNNNNNNNRRRHMIRKPSNKTGAGRTIKNRNPRPQAPIPTTATPAAPTGKPTA